MLLAGLLFGGMTALQAQSASSLVGKAPSVNASEQVLLKKQAHQAANDPAKAPKLIATPAQQAEVMALVAEMKANVNNSAYNMQAAVLKLRECPYVMYPLNVFEPEFPIVFRTGDAATDASNYADAKRAFSQSQN